MNQQETVGSHRSGFVGIVGAPNAGKSTLLNLLLGEKVAITSDKPQTTRHRIQGVWTGPNAQIIFLDTPGIHRGEGLLNRELVNQALSVLNDVDLILFMVEPTRRDEDVALAVEALKKTRKPLIAVINKIDLLKKPDLLPMMEHIQQLLSPPAIVPVSALTGENIPTLMEEIVRRLPEGPQYYPPDTLTDQPERFIAAEMIREQIFRKTGQEIPYSTAVTIQEFKEEERLVRIAADIHVERDSQKKIIIGKQGSKLKEIGTAARLDIERMTGRKVFLQLFVRVQKDWTKDPRAIQDFGYKPS